MKQHGNEFHEPDFSEAGHAHSESDVTSLVADLAGKSATTHNHALNDLAEKSYNSLTDKPTIPAASGYALLVQALTSSPADGATVYFGQLPRPPVGSANMSRVRIPKAGTIKRVYVYCYSGTAGTAEAWSLYIRLNNLTDTLIKTLSVSQAERIFDNDALNIAVVSGDYIEIKGVQPAWATNPLTTIYGGYVYIE